MWAFYFLEKPDTNPHWHGLVRFFTFESKPLALQEEIFDRNAERVWKKLVPTGTVDVQPITVQQGVIKYVAKMVPHPISYEQFVVPDEFERG
jgi:hypothetical protein